MFFSLRFFDGNNIFLLLLFGVVSLSLIDSLTVLSIWWRDTFNPTIAHPSLRCVKHPGVLTHNLAPCNYQQHRLFLLLLPSSLMLDKGQFRASHNFWQRQTLFSLFLGNELKKLERWVGETRVITRFQREGMAGSCLPVGSRDQVEYKWCIRKRVQLDWSFSGLRVDAVEISDDHSDWMEFFFFPRG